MNLAKFLGTAFSYRTPPVAASETSSFETSRRFCEIVKNTFFTEHLWATASELLHVDFILLD